VRLPYGVNAVNHATRAIHVKNDTLDGRVFTGGGYGGLDGLIGCAPVAKEEVPGVGAFGGELAGYGDVGGVAVASVYFVYRFGASGIGYLFAP
jgi:hypothetical protein